jgi:hypothetical protein
MRTYPQEELAKILELHREYLLGNKGSRADLSDANLRGANLGGAYLSCAGLSDADLSHANLSCANLIGAALSDADLSCANLADTYSQHGKYIAHAAMYGSGHGERRRQLLGIRWENGDEFWCGCFHGDENTLREYIKNGDEKLQHSRIICLNAVLDMLDVGEQRGA